MPDYDQLIEEGVRLHRAGALDHAYDKLESVATGADAPELRAQALRHMAAIHRTRCEWELAIARARESAEYAKSVGNPNLFAEALNAEALVEHSRGRFDEAASLYGEILGTVCNDRIRGLALQNLGSIAAAANELEKAGALFAESAGCFMRAGYDRGRAISLTNHSAVALDRGSYPEARHLAEHALDAARRSGDLDLVGVASLNLGEAMLKLGDTVGAESAAGAALGHFTAVENTWRCVQALQLIGDVFRDRGDTPAASRAYTAGIERARTIGADIESRRLGERLMMLGAARHPEEAVAAGR